MQSCIDKPHAKYLYLSINGSAFKTRINEKINFIYNKAKFDPCLCRILNARSNFSLSY